MVTRMLIQRFLIIILTLGNTGMAINQHLNIRQVFGHRQPPNTDTNEASINLNRALINGNFVTLAVKLKAGIL